MNQVLRVVVGVIVDPNGQILIAKRSKDAHQGGLWEFPGGKIEPNETATEALIRELEEEIGIQPIDYRSWMTINHQYSDKSVSLDIWRVDKFKGTVCGQEGQPICWVGPDQLDQYTFPEANQPIINKLKQETITE